MPAPPGESLELGPLSISGYGAMVLLGYLLWVLITARLWARGGGDPIEAAWACLIAAPAALIGARIYHVVTDFSLYQEDPGGILDVGGGGLGIFGAIAGGVLALVVYAGARGWPIATFLDCAVVGVPLAQALGRFGNWFNQELIGGPTDLPWALQVELPYRPVEYQSFAAFHPAFLYESLLNLMVFATLVVLWKPLLTRFRHGAIVGAYLVLYGAARILVEAIRIEPSVLIGPFRLNQVVAFLVLATGVLILTLLDRRRLERQRLRR
jgi:prolipoprotein diacylglyceryl transferase